MFDAKAKAALGVSALSTLGQTALQLSDYHSLALAVGLAIAMTAPAAYAGWHGANVWLEHRGKPSLKLEPLHLILLGLVGAAICLVLAAAGYAWQQSAALRGFSLTEQNQPTTATTFKKSTVFTKQQILIRNPYKRGPQAVITYKAKYASTGGRIRLFLEYRPSNYGVEFPIKRSELADLRDYVKNSDLDIAFVRKDDRLPDGAPIYYFGEEKGLSLGNYDSRIIIVDDAGNEQHYYFLITGGSAWDTAEAGGHLIPYPDFVLPDYLSFPVKWEAADEKN